MSDQMQDLFEKLDDVKGKLTITDFDNTLTHAQLRDARQELQETTDLLRQDYGKKARAQQAAIELLRAECAAIDTYNPMNCSRHFRLTQVIALLDGSEEEEEYEAE